MSKKTGQDGLLQWAQNVTSGYKDVQVDNFTMSFKDGLAFCAIVHHYRPDLLDFATCSKATPLSNHNKAFDAAEQCGVPRLLDAEDFIDLPKPDRLSVITYLSEMYHGLAKNAAAAPRKFGGLASVAAEPPSQTPAKRGTQAAALPSNNKADTEDQQPNKRRPISSSARPCAKCGEALSGTVAEFEGVGFHVACFGCFTCGKPLKSECIAVNGKPYCDTHGKEAFLASKRPHGTAAVAAAAAAETTPAQPSASAGDNTSAVAAKLAGGMASLRDKLKPAATPKQDEPPKPLPKKQSPTKHVAAAAAAAAAVPAELPPKSARKVDDNSSMPAWKRKRLEEEERERDRKANEEAARQAKIAQLTGAPPPVIAKPTPIPKPDRPVGVPIAASPPRVAASPPRVTASPPRVVASPPRVESPPAVDESSTDVAGAAAAAAAAIAAADAAAVSHAAATAAAATERLRIEAAEAEERERELVERQRRLTEAAEAAAVANEAAVRARAQTEAAAVTGPPPKLPSKRASSAVAGKCSQCNVSVFERERVDYDGLLYHRNCYRCAVCARRGGNGPSDLKLVVRDKRLLCTSHLVEATKSIVAAPARSVLPPPDANPDWAGAFQRAASPGDDNAGGGDEEVFDGPPDGPPPSLPPKRRATTAAPTPNVRPPTIVIRSYAASEYEEMTAAQQRQEASALALQVPETLEGFLLKKGDIGIIKSWKRRLFVMREDCVAYYRDMEHRRSEILQGVIPLRGCTVCSTPQTVPGSFQINAPSRIWLLQATTAEEAQRWIKNLRIASARATMKAVIKGEALPDDAAASVAPAAGDVKPRRRERAAMKEGLVHVMQGVNNQWKAQWLIVRDGVLSVHANKGDKPYIKIPLYRCGMAEYDKNNPPPNLGFDFFGSLRRLVVNEQITDFRNTFQVCGANRSVAERNRRAQAVHRVDHRFN
jgi:hypothetical protein